jgi:AmmeMemoRadiSam system protein B
MVGQSRVAVRQPAVAGLFYPGTDEQCRDAAQRLISVHPGASEAAWIGGIVPHAGWVCSGAIAGEVIGTIAQRTTPDVVVIFGAVHTPIPLERAVLSSFGQWHVPGGTSDVPADLTNEVRSSSALFVVDDRFHQREHAVEVELPLIQRTWPGAKLLPVEVPLISDAIEIGERTARSVEQNGLKVVYLASSDLTHYGPAYHFTPVGVGVEALKWAKENDRRLLDVVERFAVEQVVPEVRDRMNACGGGAIAAMLAACGLSGATRGKVLRHANSYEVLKAVHPQRPDNAVGYGGVVVG